MFEKDVDYIVQDGKVLIVDEFTGRVLPGRRYSEGVHQAIGWSLKLMLSMGI